MEDSDVDYEAVLSTLPVPPCSVVVPLPEGGLTPEEEMEYEWQRICAYDAWERCGTCKLEALKQLGGQDGWPAWDTKDPDALRRALMAVPNPYSWAYENAPRLPFDEGEAIKDETKAPSFYMGAQHIRSMEERSNSSTSGVIRRRSDSALEDENRESQERRKKEEEGRRTFSDPALKLDR